MTKRVLLLLWTAAAVAGQPAPRPAPPSKPKLVLAITIDQFRYDYLERFRTHYRGGLDRLMRQGAVFTDAHYEHFPTVTAIGHATFLSGATPSTSGIIGNEWYDRIEGRQTTSVADHSVKPLGGAGTGASPHRLLVSTLCDELKMSGNGAGKCVGMSLKDRSAILPVGRMADAAYWFDEEAGNFASSTYYFEQLPPWVAAFNASRDADAYVGMNWLPIDGDGRATPFSKLPAPAGVPYFKALERAPFGNDLLMAFARKGVEAEKLGQRGVTDILALSLSANDGVGHDFGPDDPRVRDVSIRTDRLLGGFFQFLDQSVGMANVLLVLTADHGVAPLPAIQKQRRMPGGYIPEASVASAVEQRLVELYGAPSQGGRWVVGKSGPATFLNHASIAARGLDLAAVRRQAAEAVRAIPHVARVYTWDQVAGGHLPGDRVDRRILAGFHPKRASDLFVVAEPYYVFDTKGTSHGTPYHYDSHVPVIFQGAGVRPGRHHGPVAVNDIAPTLALLLGIETPSGSVGRVLHEILPR